MPSRRTVLLIATPGTLVPDGPPRHEAPSPISHRGTRRRAGAITLRRRAGGRQVLAEAVLAGVQGLRPAVNPGLQGAQPEGLQLNEAITAPTTANARPPPAAIEQEELERLPPRATGPQGAEAEAEVHHRHHQSTTPSATTALWMTYLRLKSRSEFRIWSSLQLIKKGQQSSKN